jgi:hypothetical protein
MVITEKYFDLDDVRLFEKKKQPFKGFLTPVYIRSTEQQAKSQMYKIPPGTTEKKFHPSWFRRGLITLFLLTFMTLWFYVLVYLNKDPLVYSMVLLVLLFLLGFVFYHSFLDKKKNYLISLDALGISIAGQFYQWNHLKQTAILEIGAGRSQKNYLVLIFNDGSYQKISLQAFLTFWGFRSALSTYIEYFKNNNIT